MPAPACLQKKASAKNMSKEDYNNLSLKEKAKCNRFVICLNKLCDFVNKKPAMPSRIEDTINTVGSAEFIITADLQDSFNQIWINPIKHPYMGFHSPFGDNYIFLRSPQGLVNQSEELETMVKVVLLDVVKSGTPTRTAWKRTNIKLSPKKTASFPDGLNRLRMDKGR